MTLSMPSQSHVSRSHAWALVIQPPGLDATIAAWRGSGIEWDVSERTGSVLARDYGLDDTPGVGAWVYEGWLVRRAFRCNHPEDPEEWDESIDWVDSAWRRPTAAELADALIPKQDEDWMLLTPKDQIKLDELFKRHHCLRSNSVLYAVERRGVCYVNGHRVAQGACTPRAWLESLSVKYSPTWLRGIRSPREVTPIITQPDTAERILEDLGRSFIVCGDSNVRDLRTSGWLWLSHECRQRLYRAGIEHGSDYQVRSALRLRECPPDPSGYSLEQAEHRGWFLSNQMFPEFSKAWSNETDMASREERPEQIVLLNGHPDGFGMLVERASAPHRYRFRGPQQPAPIAPG